MQIKSDKAECFPEKYKISGRFEDVLRCDQMIDSRPRQLPFPKKKKKKFVVMLILCIVVVMEKQLLFSTIFSLFLIFFSQGFIDLFRSFKMICFISSNVPQGDLNASECLFILIPSPLPGQQAFSHTVAHNADLSLQLLWQQKREESRKSRSKFSSSR